MAARFAISTSVMVVLISPAMCDVAPTDPFKSRQKVNHNFMSLRILDIDKKTKRCGKYPTIRNFTDSMQ